MAIGKMRGAVATWWRGLRPQPNTLKDSAVAGLPRAAASVPDGMAAAALIGVNPMHGLYASFVGPIVGGLTSSTKLMVITTTSAASLAAFSALDDVPAPNRLPSLFLLTALAGVLMVLAGFLGLGRFTAFVSHSVMTGFLTGVAVSILLGQIPALVGAQVDASSSVGKASDVVTHPASISVPSMVIGLMALVLLVVLPRTRVGKYAALIALVVPSLLVVAFAYFDTVLQVADEGQIVSGLPAPSFPPIGTFSLTLLAGAFSVAAIVLVQGAGVAQAYPNPDHSRSNQDTDFMAQGLANVASGVFSGSPVGGSVSQTALNVSVGAKDRWASILSGVWVMVVLVVLSGLAGEVASPTLAAILIVASVGAIRPQQIAVVWQSGPQSQVAIATTFVATLFLPVALAVGIGVVLSLLLSINQQAQDVKVVQLGEGPGGTFVEGPVPDGLTSESILILDVYGSLFHAGARTFEAKLPDVGDAKRAVVIIRVRGRTAIGSTAFSILSAYAGTLAEAGGRLYLSGVAHELITQFEESGRITSTGPIRLVEATPVLGESTHRAITSGEAFLLGKGRAIDLDGAVPEPWFIRIVGGMRNALGGTD